MLTGVLGDHALYELTWLCPGGAHVQQKRSLLSPLFPVMATGDVVCPIADNTPPFHSPFTPL